MKISAGWSNCSGVRPEPAFPAVPSTCSSFPEGEYCFIVCPKGPADIQENYFIQNIFHKTVWKAFIWIKFLKCQEKKMWLTASLDKLLLMDFFFGKKAHDADPHQETEIHITINVKNLLPSPFNRISFHYQHFYLNFFNCLGTVVFSTHIHIV